jgi:hypothetical protein
MDLDTNFLLSNHLKGLNFFSLFIKNDSLNIHSIFTSFFLLNYIIYY